MADGVVNVTVLSHTVRAPPILLYRQHTPDQLISRTMVTHNKNYSVHGDTTVCTKLRSNYGRSDVYYKPSLAEDWAGCVVVFGLI